MVAATSEEQARAFCNALEFLLDRVNAMRIDAANARMRLIAPVIKDHGIDYERGKFQHKLDDGSLTLERTTAWINGVVREEVTAKSVELDHLLEGRAAAFVHVHSAAMLGLVTRGESVKVDTCPETLLFDVHRLNQLRNEVHYLSACVSLLLTFTHSFTSTKRPEAAAVCVGVSEAVGALETKAIGSALEVVSKAVDEKNLLPTEDAKTSLLRALEKCIKPDDAVFKLM